VDGVRITRNWLGTLSYNVRFGYNREGSFSGVTTDPTMPVREPA